MRAQSAKHRATVREAQAIIDRANGETLAMQRERDGALAKAAPRQAPLSALPVPFEFGGFSSNPPSRSVPAPIPPPHHPSPSLPPAGFGSIVGGGEGGGRRDLARDAFSLCEGVSAESCRTQQRGKGVEGAEGGEQAWHCPHPGCK